MAKMMLSITSSPIFPNMTFWHVCVSQMCPKNHEPDLTWVMESVPKCDKTPDSWSITGEPVVKPQKLDYFESTQSIKVKCGQ